MEKLINYLFLDISEQKPFKSYPFFRFFGFTRHRNFLRFLDNTKFYKHCCYEDYIEEVHTRIEKTVSFDRILFIEICKKKNINTSKFEEFYLNFKKITIENHILKFKKINQKENLYFINKFSLTKKKDYLHSLNTANLALALDICPFELFTFYSKQLFYQFNNKGVDFTNKYGFGKKIPYYHFDSFTHNDRNEFLQLIAYIIKNYKLSDFSKKLAEIYYDNIKKLLFKLIADEHKKQFYAEKRRKLEEGSFRKFTSQQMKTLYRKAAKMFHPDKNPADLETFKTVSKYYRENNYAKLLALVESKEKPSN